jgi:NADPH-dependent 2,4-dienoyl-CoA reductase/sulfur reductase-like enzyme
MQELFQDEGIEVLTNTRPTRVEGKSDHAVKLHAQRDGSAIILEGPH